MSCIIRKMKMPEIEVAAYLAYVEGWNPGIADGWAFYQADPAGFFIAEIDGVAAGCISAVKYSEKFGFIGLYVVEPLYRGTTAGTQLALAALDYLKGCNIGIDGVIERVSNYEKLGFSQAYRNARFEGIGNNYKISPKLIDALEIDRNLLYEYDKLCFPAERKMFLDAWLEMPNVHSFAFMDNNVLRGWGAIRKCRKGYKIGPLFADNFLAADEIYKGLATFACDDILFLDIPVINENAEKLTGKYEMKKVFETARMYSKKSPKIEINQIFGVTTFELG